MNVEELFVGSVAVVLGLTGITVAIGNWDRCYESRKIRWLESLGGRSLARAVFAALGVLLILLGTAIAMGYGPNRSQSPTSRSHRGYDARCFI